MKGTKGTTDGSTLVGALNASGVPTALNVDVSGNLKVTSTGGGGGGAATIADGADVTQGALADAAVTTDANGTISAKLRGLVKIFNDVWDSVGHFLLVKATQSGSWTVTSNAGTNLNTSLLALESGGNLASIKTDADSIVTNTNKIEQAQTSGGTTPFHALSAGSNNATNVKASAGQLYGICISNVSASVRWFKLYDKVSAPNPASDTVKRAIQIPANSTVICVFPKGLVFGTGISFAAVANISDTDNTSISANDLSMDLDYK